MNTADYLLDTGRPDQAAIIADGASHTYADLRSAVARLGGALRAAGVQPGDRVGLMGNNSFFWAASYLAILKQGAVAAPFAVTLTQDEWAAQAQYVHCRAILADRRVLRRYKAPGDMTVIADDALVQSAPAARPGGESAQNAAFDTARDAALMFTSGTTARPRAVRVTHGNIQANTDSIIAYLGLDPTERILVILPFYYCFGTSLLHTHLRAGATLVLANNFVYPETVLDLMEASGCTGLAGVPSTYQTLLRNTSFPRRKLKALRKVQQAGGKLSEVLIQELAAAAPQAEVYVMYGQTEATARLSYLPPSLLQSKLGSIGRGIPGVQLRVVNEAGEEVRPGETGEIVARGGNISPGYYNDPEATARRFCDGALRTGDLATVDADGFIYIVDRKDDFIKSYGHRVSSQQIEAYVMELPDVVAAAAIGQPDMVRGEAIVVFVTLRSGSPLTPDEIIAHCARRAARHLIPSSVVVMDRMPLNANGKVIKAELRKLGRAQPG